MRTRLNGLMVVALLLYGCAGSQGDMSSPAASVTSVVGYTTASTTSGVVSTPAASTPTGSTAEPVITLRGVAPASATVGLEYSFQPTASSDGALLTFAVTGQPAWLTIDAHAGTLTGTPSVDDEGTTGSIVITCASGGFSTSMAPFTIRVDHASENGTPVTNGSVALSWISPTENVDGSPLLDLAGYHIHYGTSPTALTSTIDVAGAGVTAHVISGLPSGKYYFTLASYTSDGLESAPTPVVDKSI